jgi:hypothetical protein
MRKPKASFAGDARVDACWRHQEELHLEGKEGSTHPPFEETTEGLWDSSLRSSLVRCQFQRVRR